MVRALLVFDGWTVDVRLQQFRKVKWDNSNPDGIEFLEFDSEEGEELLRSMPGTMLADEFQAAGVSV